MGNNQLGAAPESMENMQIEQLDVNWVSNGRGVYRASSAATTARPGTADGWGGLCVRSIEW